MKLSEYLNKSGRGSAAQLAKEIQAHPPDISDWASGKRVIPTRQCVAIEHATKGLVTRRELRPNDYSTYWPELVSEKQL